MTTTQNRKQRSQQQFKELSHRLKTMLGEARLQAHLGTMDLKENAGPYFDEVAAATRDAGKDFLKRARELKSHLARIRAAHRKA